MHGCSVSSIHLFGWHDQVSGGLGGYLGVFATIDDAEQFLVEQVNPPAFRAVSVAAVGVKDTGELYPLKEYRRSTCWYDGTGKLTFGQRGVTEWVIIGDNVQPMRLLRQEQTA